MENIAVILQIGLHTFAQSTCTLSMDNEHLRHACDDGIIEEFAQYLFSFVDHEAADIDLTADVRGFLQEAAGLSALGADCC